ncbi:MAG: ArsR/SmtB family transcription factor [Kiritimatiellia bacterium]
MQPLHRLFKALAEPNRLRILNLLLEEPFCVCELESFLGLPQSLLSRHLAYLRSAGLVMDRRQGMRVQYSLASDQEVVEILISCLRQALLSEEIYREDRRRCEELRAACCSSNARKSSISSEEVQIQGDAQ